MLDTGKKLSELYKTWSGALPLSVISLPGSGSYRTYYRMQGVQGSVLGAHNDDILENRAFVSFTKHFRSLGLPVPELLANDSENRIYLISDLGDTTLYQLLTSHRPLKVPFALQPDNPGNGDSFYLAGVGRTKDNFPAEIIEIYKKALEWLPRFQVMAAKELDYSVCYPRSAFDRQSMMWDLNYFKYYFLKLAKIPFDEQALEDDFSALCDLLLTAPSDFFLFRDFQSRNIMIVQNEPWFIDYQGGRRGALQYDVASLLYDAKADLPAEVRSILLEHYLDQLEKSYPVDRSAFMETYDGFVLIRILQALGAYGFRGYYENKSHFLQSIPYALRNLRSLRDHFRIGFGLQTLMGVIDRMVDTPALYFTQTSEVSGHQGNSRHELPVNQPTQSTLPAENILTVTIQSFSYKKAIPADHSGNGGGFVFDCRALPNPGRYDEYKPLTGRDQPVIDFLKKEPAVDEFLKNTFSLVDQSISAYITRGFNHLMVSYGCTGGRHRSVYCAEALTKYLKSKYEITVNLVHTEGW